MIKFTTSGAPAFNRKLKKVKRESTFTTKVMGLVGAQAVNIIKAETLAGRDANGRRFTKYTPKYIKFKQERGGDRFTGKVNLSDKGQMLSAMNYKARKNRATLFFTKTKEAQKAHGHHTGGGNNPVRRFFSISKRKQRDLISIVRKLIKRAIR